MTKKISNPQKKVAFFRVWSRHPIDHSVARAIVKCFPEYDVEVITLVEVIKRRWGVMLLNAIFVLQLYGWDILTKRKKLRDAFWRTPFIFRWVKKFVARTISPNISTYAFSFQLQSIFDTQVPGLLHFCYIDHTHLENLSYPFFDKKRLYPPKWIALERQIYQHADLLFTRSTNINHSLQLNYDCPAEKVICAYGGGNVQFSNGELKNQDYGNKNILFVGIDWERKGGPDLVEAFEMILARHPDAKLTIVGGHPKVNVPNVEVVGRVAIADLPLYYRQATIFCLPTKQEPFGMVFIEAMSYKLPIVAYKIGAIPDFVSDAHNGFLVAPGDIAALAARLNDLLANPQKCQEFGQAGFNLAVSRYNWDATCSVIRKNVTTRVSNFKNL